MLSLLPVLKVFAQSIDLPNTYGRALRLSFNELQKISRRNKFGSVVLETAYKIRSIEEEDVPQVMELRRKLRVHDVPTYLLSWMKIDPEGIKVALNENGDVIGTISFVRNNSDLYVGGLYAMHEKYRGLSIGNRLFTVGLAHAQNKNIVGNPVPYMADKYIQMKLGHLDESFQTLKNFIPDFVNSNVLSNKELPDNVEIEPYQECLLPSIVQYDTSIVGFDREQILELSCKEKNSQTFVALKNGTCVGYGSIKLSCLDAGKVGPLFADDPGVAEALLKKLLESYPNRKGFAMTTINTNDVANSFVRKLGNAEIDTCLRFYTKVMLKVDTKRIFALTDLNFSAL
ncbi:n-acetyltransferase domain-containing protein [Nephila pilipes]|uniref:N-acetyltransferase domain-containing protein n=1 Tax=Nephila pilipes TaxID=299642 RepID=A0A8X6UA62_NEPPI|nr:n-acetyltransferase domain-containing protein [Nephila pilipes]